MYEHILIATDGSEVAQKGVDQGLSLAKGLGAKVTVVTVTEPFPVYASHRYGLESGDLEHYDAERATFAQEILDPVKASAATLGVACETLHIPDRQPAEAILEAAAAANCSMIVMASHGRRGLGRLLLGSQTQEVLSNSPVPVLVIK